MTLSYLVSTAGHAQHQNEENPHDVRTILQLIEEGAEEMGDEKVIGFTSMTNTGRWTCDTFSFRELLAMSGQVIDSLQTAAIPNNDSGEERILSLLCPTGFDFLSTWIAAMRMGYGVVFVAPQCSASAVWHLHESTSSTHLVYHPKYGQLAHRVVDAHPSVQSVQLPSRKTAIECAQAHAELPINLESVSHVFHSSGTSGTPKPIPHTHIRSVSSLPRRAIPSYLPTARESSDSAGMPPSESAAFTTTPLFHGGVSDLLRAWMARSMIYFYPTSDVSITTENVVSAVQACQAAPPPLADVQEEDAVQRERKKRFSVTAFLSVPYILTVLADDLDGPGIAMLKELEFVSTGGAPLDTAIGDAMVKRGVRLVSRLGSSECGFLLSSHRDYATEKDWELLRNDSPYGEALVFEKQADPSATGAERFEMVVTDRLTSKTKTNREDGSYATGDLYELHPTKQNAWRYVGRGDDSNGEKASPGPIESTLRSSPHLSDALVVGSDRPQLGVLLFPSSAPGPADLIDFLSPLFKQANSASPSFAQISPEMCVVVTDPHRIAALPKSSKGTIQRGLANDVYQIEVQRLYDGTTDTPSAGEGREKRSPEEIRILVRDLIEKIGGGDGRTRPDSLDDSTDLFGWGVDSLMATRIRTAIQKELYVGEKPLPSNVVFEQPTITRLTQYLFNRQEGIADALNSEQDAHRLMEEMTARYGMFTGTQERAPVNGGAEGSRQQGLTIVLTGATGSLGSFLVHQLAALPLGVVHRIICLVRAPGDLEAKQRVSGVLKRRGLGEDDRVKALAADVTEDRLGLEPDTFQRLVRTADVVIHAAWPVHFASSLVSFEEQVRGTRNLLDFVQQSHRHTRFFFCSSIASVLGGSTSDPVTETFSDNPGTASAIGYSQSKWVAEAVCRQARDAGIGTGAQVLRIGQLCGDTHTGYWNEKEGWPLLLRTAQTTGSLPLLSEEPSWLPVDLAARAITDIVLHPQAAKPIYHIVHPKLVKWATVLEGVTASGIKYDRLSPPEWLERVGRSLVKKEEDPSGQMLPLWQAAYGGEAQIVQQPVIDSSCAKAASATLRAAPAIDVELMKRMIQAWRRSGFLSAST